MTQNEFEAWQAVTAASAHRWTEDVIVRLNGRGARYYQGGEDGVYIEITPEGELTAGTYEDAFPHIGEALFTPKVTNDCGSFDHAFQLACQIGGQQFMIDMFSGDKPVQLVAPVERDDNMDYAGPASIGWGSMGLM